MLELVVYGRIAGVGSGTGGVCVILQVWVMVLVVCGCITGVGAGTGSVGA